MSVLIRVFTSAKQKIKNKNSFRSDLKFGIIEFNFILHKFLKMKLSIAIISFLFNFNDPWFTPFVMWKTNR